MENRMKRWQNSRQYSDEQLEIARIVLAKIHAGEPVLKTIRSHPLPHGGYVAKDVLISVYHQQVRDGLLTEVPALLASIRMKPIRSLSGVATVTALTEPHPCPGECLFCPDDKNLPKSYLKDEPGAARAWQNHFDPYLQVSSRLVSYLATGHPTDKIELLILGGSWSAYPPDYHTWFIKRCFDAMNGTDSASLEEAQAFNETAHCRNVGLVVETRPDMVTPAELAEMRRLGVTKVQMGAQSFDDDILLRNCRGHAVEDTLRATALLRVAGFKIVLHWMPNLLGATPESDRKDFMRMWDGGFCPDELKIYPTQLVKEAPLYEFWKQGRYHPYSTDDLVQLISDIKPTIPEYCRVNRVVRDIPSDYIVEGSKRSSLRQDVHAELARRGEHCRCIRCREIREQAVEIGTLQLKDLVYYPADAEEHFINYSTPEDSLAGYLRLSLPKTGPLKDRNDARDALYDLIPELKEAALIREVHIYGQSLEVGADLAGAAQHSGLGTSLLEKSEEIAKQAGFKNLVVIAAVGTRQYYEKRGFKRARLYMAKEIL
jgi:elongator complex protein 3